jgi:VanZ family protein
LFYKILFFTALAAISILAVVPNYNALPSLVTVSDIINHITAFMVLTLLFKSAYPLLKPYLHVILLLLYGVLIEVIQHFLPARFGDFYDVVSDGVGIGIAIILTYSYATICKMIRSR